MVIGVLLKFLAGIFLASATSGTFPQVKFRTCWVGTLFFCEHDKIKK